MKTKSSVIVLTSLFSFLFTGSFSQNISTPNKLDSSFTAPNLSGSDVGPYEIRAIQKVKDFYNFLTIISSPEYDITLRKAAKKEALDLFFSADCSVDNEQAEKLLDSCLNSKQKTAWQISQVGIKEKLTLDGSNDQYKGLLNYKVSSSSDKWVERSAMVILGKKQKKFGDEMKQVWTVFICDIR
jgi:hypothetical protein